MKKMLGILLGITLLLSAVSALAAEIDLSGMSYDELVALKDQINLAMWQSDEWQEVEVPQGVWVVGEDIPAGKWTVKCAEPWINTEINWGESLTESGERIAWGGRYSVYNSVYNPNHRYYKKGDGITEYTFEVRSGDFIVVDDGSAIFMPPTGKPSLGFK